jgi:polysaccharide pyruvyl transferase WcaK-like protein
MGDEAIIEAVIQNLRDRVPALRISGFSMDPDDTSQRHAVPAYRIRRRDHTPQKTDSMLAATISVSGRSRLTVARDYLKRIALLRFFVVAARFVLRLPGVLWHESVFLRDSYRIARDVDCFLVAGSNQFLDNFGGVWGFPYTLLKWTLLARCAGARVVFLSVGAGPIDSPWSRFMVRAALLLADYASFRDAGSRELIEWFGSGKQWGVYPDLAQSLHAARFPAGILGPPPVVGINPMPVYDKRSWCEPDDARYEGYVGHLAHFASRLLRERYPVFFFATQPSDEPVIDDVIARLDRDLPTPERRSSGDTVTGIMNVIQSADIVVPTRYHGTVLGLHARRPVLGICYYRKTREVLRALGQEAYAVDLDTLDDADLWSRFETLVARRHEETQEIERRGEKVSALLAEQYDTVLEMLGARTVRRVCPADG